MGSMKPTPRQTRSIAKLTKELTELGAAPTIPRTPDNRVEARNLILGLRTRRNKIMEDKDEGNSNR